MSLSNEWEEQHLTEGGWVQGTIRYDHAIERHSVPENAYLTVCKESYIGAMGANVNVTFTEQVIIDDPDKIAELKNRFGKPTFGV